MTEAIPVEPGSKRDPGGGAISGVWIAVIVLAIVALLAAIYIFAATQSARRADRLQSISNMRQIALGLSNYEVTYKTLPPHAVYSAEGKPLLSWRVLIVPYLEVTDQPGLHKEFHLDEPWDSPHNHSLMARMPEVFANPDLDAAPGMTNYLAVVSENSAFDGTAKGVTMNTVAADSPPTIMFVEADEAVPWTKPDDLEFDAANPTAGLGGFRGDEWLAARATGKVDGIPISSVGGAKDLERQPVPAEEAVAP